MSQVTYIEKSFMPGTKGKAFAVYLVSTPNPLYVSEDDPFWIVLKDL